MLENIRAKFIFHIFSEKLLRQTLAGHLWTFLSDIIDICHKHSCGIVVLDTLWENIFVGQIFDVQWDNPDVLWIYIAEEIHIVRKCTTCRLAF